LFNLIALSATERWRLAAPLAGVEGERDGGTTGSRQCASRRL